MQGYTLAQCMLFMREAQRVENERMATLIPVVRVAVNGEGKDVEALIKGLRNG